MRLPGEMPKVGKEVVKLVVGQLGGDRYYLIDFGHATSLARNGAEWEG